MTKHKENAIRPERDRPVIEITPEMIEAGVNVLIESGALYDDDADPVRVRRLVMKILTGVVGASEVCYGIAKSRTLTR
jgi:hypothetical protein